MVRALDQRLAHMRNIEQPGELAGVEVLGENPGRIVDGHVVVGERSHPCAELDVKRVQGRLLIRGFDHGPAGREQAPAPRQAA